MSTTILNNIDLQYSELTKKIYIYDRNKKIKKDVTNSFIAVAIEHFMNNNVSDGNIVYEMIPRQIEKEG